MTNELISLLALQLVPGIGSTRAKKLINFVGSLDEVWNAGKGTLLKIPGLVSNSVSVIQSRSTFSDAENIIKECEKLSIRIITYLDRDYPYRLKDIFDAPLVLYFKGNGSLNPDRALGIVGTRQCTNYGRSVIAEMFTELPSYQPSIVSGLAYGVDIESHRKSLEYKLPTFAVLAGGLDKVYPRNHYRVAQELQEKGGLVSEQPPGVIPDAHLFPVRNRIIAGLSDATVVVEAGIKGGALITAEQADSYGRPVFAVPGNLDNVYSKGCNNLIRIQKAVIYTSAKDVAYYLNWDLDKKKQTNRQLALETLDPEESKIMNVLKDHKEGIAIDELAWKVEVPVNKLASNLLTLEFKGIVKSMPGKKYAIS